MCGIAGWFAPDAQQNVGVVSAMLERIRHRGPDDGGTFTDTGLAFGMRRLSIIDLAGGAQPMHSHDGRFVIVFNGQIYNYLELRSELAAKGAIFRTSSDTEVLIETLRAYGHDGLARLNGMFAFALWDRHGRSLLLARDRIGVKPLYWCQSWPNIAFTSEMKSLFLLPWFSAEPDAAAAAEYLVLGYVRAPRTLLRNVQKVMPGCALHIDETGVQQFRYWQPDFSARLVYSTGQAREELYQLLQDAVRLRLRSDVPVSCFLSGGLDSSAVTAFAAMQSATPVRTYSVGYSDGTNNELPYARAVATRYATDHREVMVSVTDALDRLPELVWHLDEPQADTASLSSYLISCVAAQDVKVALSGAGGDELFGGYSKYFDGRPVEHLYRLLPRWLREVVTTPLIAACSNTFGWRARLANLPDDERLAYASSFFSDDAYRLISPLREPPAFLSEAYALTTASDPVNRMMGTDLLTYLPDDVLHMTDRMSMAVSLEAREPLLDPRLVDFALGLPSAFKVAQKKRAWKILLKETLRPILPEAIIARGKQGFGAPARAWMEQGLGDLLPGLLCDSRAAAYGLIDGHGAMHYLEHGASYDAIHRGLRLWNLLNLELWTRIFIDGKAEKPATDIRAMAA